VRPPPATEVSVRLASYQLTKRKMRALEAAAAVVVSVIVVESAFSVVLPRFLSNAIEFVLPVPLNGTVCGLPGALSLMLTLAMRLPTAVGENVTEIVQVAFAASVAGLMGQVFVCA
jgi:putative effector of murein hydrolase LrgA (UPF0299 family)